MSFANVHTLAGPPRSPRPVTITGDWQRPEQERTDSNKSTEAAHSLALFIGVMHRPNRNSAAAISFAQ